MGYPDPQVADAAVVQQIRADNDNYPISTDRLTVARQHERKQADIRSGFAAASFAYGRRNAILDLMQMRPGCTVTDDADLLAEVLVPFIVEAAVLHRQANGDPRDPLVEARKCLSHAMPEWFGANPVVLDELVESAVARRVDAVALHDQARDKHVVWLPTMPELVAALRPTREEVRGLRGWGCIDPASPAERREADRLRKRKERVAKGAKPRSKSTSALKPWEAVGISRASWYRRRATTEAEGSETVSSAPLYNCHHGPDELVSPHEVVVPAQAAGFVGRFLTLSAEQVRVAVVHHPVLSSDIRSHLGALDALMSKTPVHNHKVVLKNLLRDRARSVRANLREAA